MVTLVPARGDLLSQLSGRGGERFPLRGMKQEFAWRPARRWAPRLDPRSTNSQSLQSGGKGRGSSQHVCGNSTLLGGSGLSHLRGSSCYLLPNCHKQQQSKAGCQHMRQKRLGPLTFIICSSGNDHVSIFLGLGGERGRCYAESGEPPGWDIVPASWGRSFPPPANPRLPRRCAVAENTFGMLLFVSCSEGHALHPNSIFMRSDSGKRQQEAP